MHRAPGYSPGFSPGRRASPRGWRPPGHAHGGHGGRYGGSPRFSPPGFSPQGFSPPGGFQGPGFSSPGGFQGPGRGQRGSPGFRGRRWEQEPRRGGFSPADRSQENVSVEKYFSLSMIQDPWKDLSPVSKDQLQTGSKPGLRPEPGVQRPAPDRL
ncbi:hypothetical protein WMY93_031628 [Mugilogobius chulae]|uniref:Uncharacterized protein n=1 Tax=Mugilogobius chulae TaxID=88201 RepID=A0AAW0MLI9_9GOBI